MAIIFLDAIATAGALAGLVFFFRMPQARWPHFTRLPLLFILLCGVFAGLSSISASTGLSTFLEVYEDYTAVVLAPFWLFLFYSFLYQRSSRQIRENADRLHTILEAVQTGILVIDQKDHRILNANAVALQMLGQERHELQGQICHNYICPRQQGHCPVSLSYEQQKNMECYLLRKTGEQVAILKTVVSVDIGGRPCLIESFVDIDARKKKEEELKQSEERMDLALQASNDGMWDLNPQTKRVYFSPRWFSLLGYQPGELPQEYATWIKLLHPEDQCRAKTEMKSHTLSGRPFTVEFRMRHKDGRWRWIQSRGKCVETNADGEPSRLVGTHTDISVRKELEEKHRRLAIAVEQSAESIVITNREGVIEYVNPAFESITGYTQEEALGENPRVLKSGHQAQAFYEQMWTTLKDGSIWKGRLVNRKKNGALYTEEATISPIRDDENVIVGFVAVKRDVTHEVELEKRMRQSQKLEAIGTLAGGIAHDFNNILQAILGYTELAIPENTPGSMAHTSLSEVIKAGHRAADLVAQILAFSRQDDQEQQAMRLQTVVKEALKLLRGSLPTTIEIRSYIKADCGPVMADPTQIHQVIMNLCTNSFHAMRQEGGLLEVRLEEVQLQAEFTDRYPDLEPGKYVRLTVSDNGYGMDPQTLERAFEPYFTTKEKGEGTGLGLSTVHGIVKSHRGVVSVYSELGQGSTFKIYLPLCSQRSDAPDLIGETAPPKGTARVLFVDDEESIVEMGKASLTRLGYTVYPFSNATDALFFFNKNPYVIDVLITDQTMPKLTGVDLAERFLELRPDLPIILCSGFSESINADDIQRLGIREYLMKPVVSRDFAFAIQRVLGPIDHAHKG